VDEDRRGWRALPPPLLLALGLTAVRTIAPVVFESDVGSVGASLATLGVDATANALFACGALELARQHTGACRRGLQIATAGWFAALTLHFVWLGVFVMQQYLWPSGDDGWLTVEHDSWFVVEVLPFVGLGLATMRRSRVLALVSVVTAVARHPPPFAARAIWGWLALDAEDGTLLEAMLSLLGIALIAALARMLAPATRMPEPGRAAVGLRRASTALRIQVIAVILDTYSTLFAPARHVGASEVYPLVMVAGLAIHAAAAGWFAVGLLGAARDGALSRAKLVLAGSTSLWAGAVMLAQFLFAYARMYGLGNRWTPTFIEALSFGVPLVALAGIAILAAELGRVFAEHRQEPLEDAGEIGRRRSSFVGLVARSRDQRLWRDTTGQLAWIIVLMLASAVFEGLWPPSAFSGEWEPLTLVAAGCALVALSRIAQLCRAAAEALEHGRGLPAARVIAAS